METRGTGSEYSKTVELDGTSYTIHMLPPTRAFKLSAKIIKMFGEPMAAMASSAGNGDKALELLPKAVGMLCKNLHEDEALALVKELVNTVKVNRTHDIDFESHFQGKLGLLMKLVMKAAEVQLGDFFSVIGQQLGGVDGTAA